LRIPSIAFCFCLSCQVTDGSIGVGNGTRSRRLLVMVIMVVEYQLMVQMEPVQNHWVMVEKSHLQLVVVVFLMVLYVVDNVHQLFVLDLDVHIDLLHLNVDQLVVLNISKN
jgi:hypothetical protein